MFLDLEDVCPVEYKAASVDGVSLFYRDAGPRDAPTIVLLHGFPSSSRMFSTLFPLLSSRVVSYFKGYVSGLTSVGRILCFFLAMLPKR